MQTFVSITSNTNAAVDLSIIDHEFPIMEI